jgi:hypothetical protein
MLDAFHADESIRHLLDLGPFAFHDQDFQAVIMVEMHVHARQHEFMKSVLKIDEFLRERRHVMIVNERDRSHRLLILIPLLSDQIVPNQIAERLGSIRVLLPRNVPIEVIQEMMIEGDTEANEFFHCADQSYYESRVTNL